MAKKNVARKGGAPRKAPGGLDKVLFVRADQDLLTRLDELQKKKSNAVGVVLSRSDVARALLKDALDREG